jgi:small-conductance mechanosensitive channel
VVCVVVLFLRIFKLWKPTVNLLNSMTLELGKISISVWGLIEAIIIFILLYAICNYQLVSMGLFQRPIALQDSCAARK